MSWRKMEWTYLVIQNNVITLLMTLGLKFIILAKMKVLVLKSLSYMDIVGFLRQKLCR